MQILNERHEVGLEPFLQDFLKNRFIEIEEIAVALTVNNFSLLKSYAHNWKGFSRPYGFIKLEELAVELESSALAEDFANCRKILFEIKNYLEYKKQALG